MPSDKLHKRVAILDLNNGEENQGMRCIREILGLYGAARGLDIMVRDFDVRRRLEFPDASYDAYISSGGPGSPLDSEGSSWERGYFSLIRELDAANRSGLGPPRKVFFICHSFQLLCRHYGVGIVCRRRSPSFGVYPVHLTGAGRADPVFGGLPDPFPAVDSREWQVVAAAGEEPAMRGLQVLALEKPRPHVPLARALLAVRFSPWFIGTQFHPEADPEGMTAYLEREDKKRQVEGTLGHRKYDKMLHGLQDTATLAMTRRLVLPAFLDDALGGA